MLPDFPRLKVAAYQYFIRRISESSSQGLVANVPTIPMYEGDAIAMSDSAHSKREELQKAEARLEINDEDLIRNGFDAYLSKIDAISEKFASQKEKLLIGKIREVTTATGTAIDAQGQPLSPSHILNALEKMEIEFDDTGKIKNLALVMHPDQVQDFRKKAAEWERDLEFQKKFRELMERKKAEWRDRESSRKLVD